MLNIIFEEDKQKLIGLGCKKYSEKCANIICNDCDQVFYTSYYERIINRKPDVDNYFLCRHCKKQRRLLIKQELKENLKKSIDYKKVFSDRSDRSKKVAIIVKKNKQLAESQECCYSLDEVMNQSFSYIKYKCSCCNQEKISKKETVIKNNLKCPDCIGLDTIERKTGYRGVLNNPVNLKKLDDSFKKKYGVHRPFQLKSIQDKVSKTFNDRYGYRKTGWADKDLMKSKYGVDNASYLPWVQEKIMKSLSQKHKDYYNKIIDNSFDFSKMNKLELDFYHLIKQLGTFSFSNREILKTSEIDFFNVDLNEGYEIGALYWHTVAEKGTNYHFNKFKKSEKANIKLYQFFSHEFSKLNNIILSYLRNESFEIKEYSDGDESEFNFFNISFKKHNFDIFKKITDSNGGKYILGENQGFCQIFPTNENGSLFNLSKTINQEKNIICDNRIIPIINNDTYKLFDQSEMIFQKTIVQDAGYKLILKGELK